MAAGEIATVAIKLMATAVERGWFERLRNALRERHRVIIVGSSGVGKTNFLHSLTSPLPDAIDAINRSEFARSHKLSIAKAPFEFIDTPGQQLHEKRFKDALRGQIGKGKVGILNVNAFGFHEYELARADAFECNGDVSASYLENHRRVEIEFAASWAPLLGDPGTSHWLINVITKADLWWAQHEQVMAYYQRGAYWSALGEAQSLKPVTAEYCSVIHQFYDRGPVSPKFDDGIRKRLRAHLFQTLLEAIGGSDA